SLVPIACLSSFYFNPPPTTPIYSLSLHDALPISPAGQWRRLPAELPDKYPDGGPPAQKSTRAPGPADSRPRGAGSRRPALRAVQDRKSTRLNSSHVSISYAVFCLKKKTTEADSS